MHATAPDPHTHPDTDAVSAHLRRFESIDEARTALGDPDDSVFDHPGWCWPDPRQDLPDRKCWVVVLPDPRGAIWTTTTRASDPPHELWDITGEPPDMTVTPSIDVQVEGGWHGHITNGELTP